MATKKKNSIHKTKQPAGDAHSVELRLASKPPTDDSTTPGGAEASREDTGKLSALNAAALVLAESADPMNCQEMIAIMAEKGLWTSPAGKTPGSTLYSSILKEIRSKGAQSRFQKVSRGKFART